MLYLLSEEKEQVDFHTKVKYLYNSGFSKRAVGYLENTGKRYAFLSFTYGLLLPEEYIDPYKVERLGAKKEELWAVMVGIQISNLVEMGESICLLYSEGLYGKLEDIIRKGYRIKDPIKNFGSNELKILKLEEMIKGEVENRLKGRID